MARGNVCGHGLTRAFSLSTDIWQERPLPPPRGLGAHTAGSPSAHVHKAPLKHRRKREELCRQDAPPGATIVSAHLHDTKPFSQVQVLAAANMLPNEADFPPGNDSLSAPSVQRESVALLGLFPNYRDSGHKRQTSPSHMTPIRSVSCKSAMPHARRVLGSQAGGTPAGSRTLCMYTEP